MAKSSIDIIREEAESDFVSFIHLVAPYILLGDVHHEFAHFLTRPDGKDNKLGLLPRGHMKSKIAAFLAAWIITRDPSETILYASSTAALAEEQLSEIKNILDSEIYRRYWPEMIHPEEGKRERWAVANIKVDHPKRKQEGVRDPTVKAIGAGGSMTGFHASTVILDDLVEPKNAYTEEGRKSVAATYSQLASIENPGAKEIVIGTRYHPRDLYNTLINMKEITFTEDGEEEGEEEVYDIFQRVVETDGEFLWPRKTRSDGKPFGFDARILARIKAKYVDRAQFFAQYYNNPNASEDSPIDASRFQYYDRKNVAQESDGHWYIGHQRLNIFAAIDFAFSMRSKADYTAIVVVGVDSRNNFYVLDIDRFRTDKMSVYFEHIYASYVKWSYRKLRAEVSVAQKVIVNSLKEYLKENGLPLSIDEHRPTRNDGDKAERISAVLEPRYENLQIWHYRGGNCQILEEEVTMERPPHDDVKDALANAIDIAKPPAKNWGSNVIQVKSFNTHPRFGGCT